MLRLPTYPLRFSWSTTYWNKPVVAALNLAYSSKTLKNPTYRYKENYTVTTLTHRYSSFHNLSFSLQIGDFAHPISMQYHYATLKLGFRVILELLLTNWEFRKQRNTNSEILSSDL